MSAVLVLGGAHGIGEATSRTLATQPWTDELIIADLDLAGAESLADELRRGGSRVSAAHVDLGAPDTIYRLVEETSASDVRKLAIVAGTAEAPQFPIPQQELQRIININLIGAYTAAQSFAQPMMEKGEGSIVAVASICARIPRRMLVAYCASKAGLVMGLRVLAMESSRKGVRVNTVSPGSVDSKSSNSRSWSATTKVDRAAGSLEWSRLPIPDGRVGLPQDIADSIAFLLSPAAGHVNMQDLVIDGGETLGM